MKVKVIRGKGNDNGFDRGWVTEGKVYTVVEKHEVFDDGYYISDNDGDELLFWDYELEFVED